MARKRGWGLIGPLVLFMAVLLHSIDGSRTVDARTPDSETVVLDGATLIDGRGGPPIVNAVLVIEDGVIRAAGPASDKGIRVPEGARRIHLPGKTIMPALINLHGHLGLTRDGLHASTDGYTEENIRHQLEQYLAYGVATVMSLGTDQDSLIYKLRAEQGAGSFPGARLYTAGRGFGVMKGLPPFGVPSFPGATDRYRPETPEEARADVRELAGHQPDMVKTWVDDDLGRAPKMKPEIYRAIIDEAHRHHLRVMAHVFYLDDAQALVDAGVEGLAHSVRDQAVSPRLIESMKARGVFLVPTLVREESVVAYAQGPVWLHDPFFDAGLLLGSLDTLSSRAFMDPLRSDPYHEKQEATFEMAKKNLKMLFDAGVKVGFGTDSGVPLRFPGYFEHRELQLMVESGLTPIEAITCATRNNAEFLEASKHLGTLEPGKQADFLVLGANPLEDIHNTEKLEMVWHAGRETPTVGRN